MGQSKIVECVPNFSEGRRSDVVSAILAEVGRYDGVKLLDSHSDPDHNRTVVTFAGEPSPVMLAAFACARKAAELIDLTKHQGQHPRMGATDVVPFVPIHDVTTEECVELARQLGAMMGAQLGIPVFLYADAATVPARKELENVRRGEFEGLRDKIGASPDHKPDFGPERIHPTAGATAVGVRMPLVAYNVNLATGDLKLAKAIAKTIRQSGGGLPTLKALGLPLSGGGTVQVSMNLTNYKVTSILTAFNAVRENAAKAGVEIVESEIVGLVPREAMKGVEPAAIRLTRFSDEQIVESRLGL
jgi:glutamate formiminotransferase